ncbi:MAG: type II toxin-antitoxin system RelB/DinJ family antitoxin [Parcubacteria group bacterium]|nr:type II toxin-antitoxin system RelB/DinJ family antitoxin [Parcubacteria group bacterium]
MKTIINIKADKEVKESAQRIAADMGLPLSAVINAYLKEFIRERAVRFSLEPQLRPEVEKEIGQAIKDYKSGENIVGPFENAKSLMKSLSAK